jgi:hypothetical protein
MVKIEPSPQLVGHCLLQQSLQDLQVMGHRAFVKQLRATLCEELPQSAEAI